MTQIPFPSEAAPTLLTVTDVKATLQPDALVVAFTVDGDDVHVIKWHAKDAMKVRDLARQLVTLAEGMPGAESMCLCELFRPKCPVHHLFAPRNNTASEEICR